MGKGAGGGGGIYLITSFIRGSAPRSSPLPFYVLFLTEKITLSHAFGTCKWYTIHIPSLEFYIHLTALQFIKILLNYNVFLPFSQPYNVFLGRPK